MDNPETATRLDPRDYLARIGFTTPEHMDFQRPSLILLQALHEAHMLAVPFENLSIHYGQPIVLRNELLCDKIVRRRRGGFCYELNGMFAWLLRQLEYRVTLLSAEVAESGGNFSPAYDHLALLVHDVDGTDRLADVGFGDSFRRPLRMDPCVEQGGGDGYIYRLRVGQNRDHAQTERVQFPYWLVERYGSDSGVQWELVYRFTLRPHVLTDFTERCIFQQTSPDSHFTQKRICSLALPDGRISLSDLRLITARGGKREERMLASEDEYQTVLADHFGIVI
ncbi:MAG TPA: arylamine N-acetyltransferase [Ktedonobacterales bacterium]|nr:arylamine N-acetyltransferase [Ktedonobacterales bacterium]